MLKIYQLRLKQNTFEVTFKYRGVGVRVAFVDGNTYNGTPAKCYTNDAFKQRAIEASQMFKDKDIVLERCVAEESDKKKAEETAGKRPMAQTGETAGTAAGIPAGNAAGMTADADVMTFDNAGEAIKYIAQNWQVAVQTETEARKVLKEHGINARIKRG